ncbi:uncharacterized protein BO87DRAFT_449368 [Aspergillus neoniger CBS 115656]|uniref:Integral membrane protein n=1 Tax=Aspergillus neoniger (strain CBS 115656) TaxID=1448310 RepID=A0A318Y470_ASPNB|nr:integral membrane protein [Aspergillus neoniger CBS 115656]PYH29061.1 integral membrane protein [Aspergillus neoniger CBS 115656]
MPGGLHPPLSVMESWPARNTINPETHGAASIALPVIFGSIAVTAVILRLWARCVIQRQGKLDDIFIALALIPAIGLNISFPLGAYTYGENHHVWDNTLPQLLQSRKLAIAQELFYILSSCFTKISVLLFYRRMGHRTTISPRFLNIIYISIASVAAYTLAFFIVIWVACRPFSAYWMEVDPEYTATHKYTCYNEPAHLIAATFISLVQDIVATTLPAVLCWSLQMRLRQKVLLNGVVFGLGYLAAVVAGVRVWFLYRMFYVSYDASWDVWYCWVLAMLEVDVAVGCSCLPGVNVFVRSVGCGGGRKGGSGSGSGVGSWSWRVGRSRSWSWKWVKEGGVGVHVSTRMRANTVDGEARGVKNEGGERGSNDTERDLLDRQAGSVVELKVYRQVSEGEV